MTKPIPCAEFEDLAILFAAGELTAEQRVGVEEHAAACAACAEILEREMTFRAILAVRSEAAADQDGSGLLLARCRSELSESLDDAADTTAGKHAAKWHERFSPARWAREFRRALAFHPGWSAAALLLAGALGGTVARTWYRETSLPLPGKPVMTVSAAPRLTDKELETMGIEGIRWDTEGGGSQPQVEVHLLSKQPVVVEGTSDDAEIRRVLTYVVEHGQRFDPGVRLDSLDVLRTRAADPRVRAALCAAVRSDGNAAVRLKALESLSGLSADPAVQETILGALAEDDNSGVRIEAVNALQAALGTADPAAQLLPRTMEVLRDRERNDPNSYVRLRSARVLGRLTSADGNGNASKSGRPYP